MQFAAWELCIVSRYAEAVLFGRLVLLLCMSVIVARAGEIHIRFAALERMLASTLFTEEGRRYVRGNKDARCNYAWLEKPQVRSENGRLSISAKFTGKTALDVFGRCVGMGDSFDIRILALPYYKNGFVGLRDVDVQPVNRSGFYAGRVCASMSSSLARDFRYPLGTEARKGLEDPGAQPAYPRELRRFSVGGIRVTTDGLVLAVDFDLLVK